MIPYKKKCPLEGRLNFKNENEWDPKVIESAHWAALFPTCIDQHTLAPTYMIVCNNVSFCEI